MPYTPHTDHDIKEMLSTLGIADVQQLFDEIPSSLQHPDISSIPDGLTEQEIHRLMLERQPKSDMKNFIGAGAYEHYIPAAVWQIVGRGEFYTAYTPYQAEASQGNLQLMYEYQTMMASLLGMDVSNASLYDGASALAEAVLMAIRIKKNKANTVLLPRNIHPNYRKTLKTLLKPQNINLQEIDYNLGTGEIDFSNLETQALDNTAALIIPQPNFFGILEAVDKLSNWAHQNHLLVIAIVNPIAMTLIKEPGSWGEEGADITCGEGQPLGVPLSGGGPYFGFMACKKQFLRQLPGRIVGKTKDKNGQQGYTLTLQAREQHIRRAKATSNICTNQGLLVTAATIYMTLLGPKGLKQVATKSHHNAYALAEKLEKLDGVELCFPSCFFHEFVIKTKIPAKILIEKLAEENLQAGFNLKNDYPELENCLLVCVTETKTDKDITTYAKSVEQVIPDQTCDDDASKTADNQKLG